MTIATLAQGRPAPTIEQMRNLLEARIREEVLYREALAMGLDKDDIIVKRRMLQKMDFLAEDLSDLREPSREELQAWFKNNAQRFAYPPRISFRHLYFSFDKHGANTAGAAAAALKQIAGKPANSPDMAALADPFMFRDYYADRSPDQVGSEFGGKFERSVFELKPGSWLGPLESGFGWHLVFVDSLTPGRVPEFAEVESEVKSEWIKDQRAEFKRKAYEAMKARYEIVLPTERARPRAAAIRPTELRLLARRRTRPRPTSLQHGWGDCEHAMAETSSVLSARALSPCAIAWRVDFRHEPCGNGLCSLPCGAHPDDFRAGTRLRWAVRACGA